MMFSFKRFFHRVAIFGALSTTGAMLVTCSDQAPGDDDVDEEDEFRVVSWTRDSHGNYYRSATSLELTNNKWPAGTYLVNYAPANVRTNRELPLVTSDTQVQYVPLDAAVTSTGVQYHALSFAVSGVVTTTPTFYRLRSTTSSSVKGHVTMDSGNGLYAHMTVPGISPASREVLAAESNAFLESIALPGGGVPSASNLLVVHTPDPGVAPATDVVTVPNPSSSVPFAMFGTIYWCQQHTTNWKSLISESSFEIRAGFRNEEPGPGTTDTNWNVVLGKSWCMFWNVNDNSRAAVDHAKACEWGKDPANNCSALTCTDTQGKAYPMTGCYKLAGCFNDKVWDAVTYADNYLALPDLMVVQAQTWGALQDPSNPNAASPSCPSESTPQGVPFLCGLAKTPNAGSLAGASVTPGRPYSLWPPTEPMLSACGTPFVWTHEVGHNFSAAHEVNVFDNAPNNSGCDKYKTLMQISDAPATYCRENWFSVDMTSQMLSNCVVGSCPRSAPYVDHLP